MDEGTIARVTEHLWGHRWERQSVIRTSGSVKPESELSFTWLFFLYPSVVLGVI